MPETWIRPNRRALSLGLIVPVVLMLAGIALWLAAASWATWPARLAALVLCILGAVLLGTLWRMMRQPRIAYLAGDLLIYLGRPEPERVPIEHVECFFLGQAGGMIPDAAGREAEVRTVIIRLAESAAEYHHRDVKAALGHWCEGYITIRGTWCEPITAELMKQLNSRLVEVKRETKAEVAA